MMRTFPLILSFLVVRTTPIAAGEVKSYEHTYAANDRYRVVLVSRGDYKLCMRVIEDGGKLLWKTQPSSGVIRAALDRNRIVIFTKTRGPGMIDVHRPAPTRGGRMFTLTGEEVGVLPPSVYDGEFAGPVFLARKVGGGVIAYDLEAAKELWCAEKRHMHWVSLAGPGLVNLRWYKGQKEGYENWLVSLRSGKIVQQVSSPSKERVSILAAYEERYVTLRALKGTGLAADWQSELHDKTGRQVPEIRWQGQPIAASFSPNGGRLAAVCACLVEENGREQIHYVFEVYTHDGKRFQQEKLLTADAGRLFGASIIFDTQHVHARLTRKLEVRLEEGVPDAD